MIMHNIAARLLQAGLSSHLYHITSLRSAVSILQKDRFELTPSDANISEIALSGAVYYLSLARVPSSRYIRTEAYKMSVIFEIDGRKLGHHYKGSAVDYWGSPQHQEAEDRLVTQDPILPHASLYIKAAHAIAQHDQYTYQLYKWCKLRKVPLHFYETSNYRNFVTMHPKYRVDYKPTRQSAPVYEDRTARWKDNNRLRGWLNLYRVNTRNNPQKSAGVNRGLRDAYSLLIAIDAVPALSADMHNARSQPYGTLARERETLDELVKIMRKHNVDLKGYIGMMRDKWYPKN